MLNRKSGPPPILSSPLFLPALFQLLNVLTSGWGWINWGNAGTSQFVGAKDLLNPYYVGEMYEGLRNTDSIEASSVSSFEY